MKTCRKCGTENDATARICAQCDAAFPRVMVKAKPLPPTPSAPPQEGTAVARPMLVSPSNQGASSSPAISVPDVENSEDQPRSWRIWFRTSPWATSAAVHVVIFVLLALVTFQQLIFDGSSDIELVTTSVPLVEDSLLLPVPLDLDNELDSVDDSLPLPSQTTEAEETPSDIEPMDFEESIAPPTEPVALDLDRMLKDVGSDPAKQIPGVIRRVASQTAEVKEATEIGGAVNRITEAIRKESEMGDTLVVWLLDASISLVDDRKAVAELLEPFYKSIDAFDTTRRQSNREYELMNAVVAYGNHWKEMEKPTRFGARVVNALQNVPPDVSGKENVMSAIQASVQYYRIKKKRRDRMIFVVWTDESGDDTRMLEETISMCKYGGVAVHVVGPSSVLGMERGSHHWVDPKSRLQFLLPVKRGPDTAMPQRMLLPYWHESTLPPWSQNGARVANGVPWYGGAYRERLLSGFGPYALTRLALQTGGSFTLLDREGDRGPYRLDVMRDYLPSYESARQYHAQVSRQPIRKAVSEAVALINSNQNSFLPPQFVFRGIRSRFFPYRVLRVYMSQAKFRRELKSALAVEQRRIARAHEIIERAIAHFRSPDVDWAYEYQSEKSRRWRAWHDLTLGRLLATSVRYREYGRLCAELSKNPGMLNDQTNNLMFVPVQQLRETSSNERATEAAKLLRRCVDEHPETPWADLAQWELDKALGVNYVESVIPKPPPPRPVARTGPVRRPRSFSFPSL